MAGHQVDATWMWHPHFDETDVNCAGQFVHFRKLLHIHSEQDLPESLPIHVTADTRYKLYVNHQLVSFGPVKGDANLWFFDEVDIAPFLILGQNHIGVHVLRYFHATQYAASFPRLPTGGLRMQAVNSKHPLRTKIESSTSWETAIDPFVKLRVDDPEDDFLHVYEYGTAAPGGSLQWVPAQLLQFQSSTGQSTPWNLSSRMIPFQTLEPVAIGALHNLRSGIPIDSWSAVLLSPSTQGTSQRDFYGSSSANTLLLPAGSKHQIDLEVTEHMTAFIELHFERLNNFGSMIELTYSESYEDAPILIPYLRRKGHRQDYTKELFGPRDLYELRGTSNVDQLGYGGAEDTKEIIIPFHFRTFRFIRLKITVGDYDLVLNQFVIKRTNYPLDVTASINTCSDPDFLSLWDVSIRTLANCMHDCYEDCPFYEQLQYAMDTRSSILFTYYVSGDDRLARQAIIQLRNSFQANIGLTASRAPSHRLQIIPHFSLYWISMVCDHWLHFGDSDFAKQFLPIIDAVLDYFHRRIDRKFFLVASEDRPGIWNYHDWADAWRPYGIPPSVLQTGISTYTNCLYAYTLKNAASMLRDSGRSALAIEYMERANHVTDAVVKYCFDGRYFTDSLANSNNEGCHSQMNQAWAVLCGAATGGLATKILRDSLNGGAEDEFIATSISMSFYVLRALSLAGSATYNHQFDHFWDPWRSQLALGLTTWEEDHVSHRSDCHAWGCAPIFELLAEVAGVQPTEPGWAAIDFKPRITLFREFAVTIPLRSNEGGVQGHVYVAWATTDSHELIVRLSVKLSSATVVPIRVTLPSLPLQSVESGCEHIFTVKLKHICNGD